MSNSRDWKLCCTKVPKEQVVFICQVVTALIVIVCGLLNIALTKENTSLWATLVSGAVGYLLPGPRLNSRPTSKEDESFLHDTPLEFIDGVPSGEHSITVHDGASPTGGTDG